VRIAVFDYKVNRNNPIGGCHLRMLRALASEHDFTVFAVEFDNPHPDRIKWVRVPVPMRPLALLFVTFHVVAPILYLLHLMRTGRRFDLVQGVESNLLFGDISYSHFCHRAYLKHHWRQSGQAGFRGFLNWLDHFVHACLERPAYQRAKGIVAPSRGLARELNREYPFAANKIRVLPNAVDADRLRMPAGFDRKAFRKGIGLSPADTAFVFVALGHFERKGLPLLLEALSRMDDPTAKLIIVGGAPDLVQSYQPRIGEMNCRGRVHFAGMQADVRPYFWAADAFAFPSLYETFSLVAYEAAAAGLPLIVPRLNGIEEIIRDGDNGFIIGRTVDDAVSALRRFLTLAAEQRRAMGRQARAAAAAYDNARFVGEWAEFYRQWAALPASHPQQAPEPARH